MIAVARRRVFRIEALAKQLGEEKLVPMTADMAAPGEADTLVRTGRRALGPASMGSSTASTDRFDLNALDISDAEFDMTMQVNVKSALYGVQAVAPVFRQQGQGAVVIYNPTPVRTEDVRGFGGRVQRRRPRPVRPVRRLGAPTGAGRVWPWQEVAPVPDADSQSVARLLQHDVLLLDALRAALLAPPICRTRTLAVSRGSHPRHVHRSRPRSSCRPAADCP